MNPKSKIQKINSLSEKELRETLLVPLLSRMGFVAPTLYHGPRERGKDIVCYSLDKLRKREYMAVVAKAVDLSGSVSSPTGLSDIVAQVEQCFDVPYEDLFGMTKITMDRVWVVTSKSIVPGASEAVYSKLEKTNLSKLTRFISGENLVELIDEHYQGYWSESLEPIEILREQKNRLFSFTRNLLISLGTDRSSIDTTLNQVLNSDISPEIMTSRQRLISRLSPYSVQIDEISEDFSNDFHSDVCGLIGEQFRKAKEATYWAMQSVEEVVDAYEDIIRKVDPQEFVTEFNKRLAEQDPFYRPSWGRGADALHEIGYLEEGLNDIVDFTNRLKNANKYEWAAALSNSVKKLKVDIHEFLINVDKEKFVLWWNIEESEDGPKLRLSHSYTLTETENFETNHTKDIKHYGRRQGQTTPLSVNDVIDTVQARLRVYLEELLTTLGYPREE